MHVTSYSEARENFKNIIDKTIDDADVTLIHRRKGGNAVLMSEDYYNSMVETLHLLSNPSNAKHLAQSIEQHKAGKAVKRELIDVDE
ncbi:MAG: Antitoxin YefM [Acinetobacter bereziniae]|uniref:Antitoxin n=1 Tax=Acinetobacter bereziniae TaxID=106648 RepID=A0A833PCB7_ACIBZ|nr:MAG: Antitoxin YefM [Acinetobacter bereziniae]